MDAKTLKKLTAPRAEAKSPNVMKLDLDGGPDGEKTILPAGKPARAIAQNLIEQVEGHGHLREARVLLLFRTGQNANADGQIELGKAQKANPLLRLLTGRRGKPPADFVITLNADMWPQMDDAGQVALVDHELVHCTVTIAGKRFGEAMSEKIRKFEQALGGEKGDWRGTKAIGDGKVAVRFVKRQGPVPPGEKGYSEQRPVWRMRKHDVQEFVDVVERNGPWDAALQAMVDVWEPDDDGQHTLDLHAAEDEAA